MKSFRLALIPASFGTIFCVSVLAQDPSTVSAPTVEVISTTPVPGLEMSKEKVPGNVQTISGKTIAAARPVTLNSLLDDNVGSINVNNYQGNPFQPDVTYRGFSASPLLGTPQGLSVYLDSVRINEPFGDVVAWDLIPINAISRVDVIPGSNPLYGLNTLGGAIALHTKDGFTDPGGHVEASWGSWNRRNVWAEVGGSRDNFGLYLNANHFEENGWRDFSPSSVDQFFGKASVRTERTSLDLSVLYANTTLVGNGLTPLSILQQRWGGVFTVPDQTKNEVSQIALSGTQELDSHNQIGGSAYYRRARGSKLNGDFFDDFTDTDFEAQAQPVLRRARVRRSTPPTGLHRLGCSTARRLRKTAKARRCNIPTCKMPTASRSAPPTTTATLTTRRRHNSACWTTTVRCRSRRGCLSSGPMRFCRTR